MKVLKQFLVYILGAFAQIVGAVLLMFAGLPWDLAFLLLIFGGLAWIVFFIIRQNKRGAAGDGTPTE